jgi:hypothetical protein
VVAPCRIDPILGSCQQLAAATHSHGAHAAHERHAQPRRTRSTRAPHTHHTSAWPQRQCRTAAGQGRFLRRGGTAGKSPTALRRKLRRPGNQAALRRKLRRCSASSPSGAAEEEAAASRARRPAADGSTNQRRRVAFRRCRDGVPPCSRSANRNEVPGTWYAPTFPFPGCSHPISLSLLSLHEETMGVVSGLSCSIGWKTSIKQQ